MLFFFSRLWSFPAQILIYILYFYHFSARTWQFIIIVIKSTLKQHFDPLPCKSSISQFIYYCPRFPFYFNPWIRQVFLDTAFFKRFDLPIYVGNFTFLLAYQNFSLKRWGMVVPKPAQVLRVWTDAVKPPLHQSAWNRWRPKDPSLSGSFWAACICP